MTDLKPQVNVRRIDAGNLLSRARFHELIVDEEA